ncbi:hypothetical protein FQN50_008422 [Emmonsiellopsis sp. PD_5]|nr:hypothetical protein FQN50_008422 [Emmonsiellopsis sp. PD_5]
MAPHRCNCAYRTSESTRGPHAKGQPPHPDHGLTEEVATKLALEALDSHKNSNVKTPKPCPIHGVSSLVLLYQVFDTLDKELFRGVLKDEVHLRTESSNKIFHGTTSIPHMKDSRITITLNAKTSADIPFEDLLAILIHHMAHAYFLVCCGYTWSSGGNKYRLDHGLGYSCVLYKIMEVFRPKGIELPDLFHCFWGYRPTKDGQRVDAKSRHGIISCPYRCGDYEDKENCRIRSSELKEMKLGKKDIIHPKTHYFHTVDLEKGKFTPVLRSRRPINPNAFVEFHYSTYAIPMHAEEILDHPCLLVARDNGNIIKVPAKSDEIFLAFYNYLKNGDYAPKPPPVTARNKTASVIKAHHPKGPEYILTDIRVFILASKLDFDELRAHALKRLLHSYEYIHEDPMAPLEEIYNDKDFKRQGDKNKLREWVQKFLARARPQDGVTNMTVLQCPEWIERFEKLRTSSQLFAGDCAEVHEELKEEEEKKRSREQEGKKKLKEKEEKKQGRQSFPSRHQDQSHRQGEPSGHRPRVRWESDIHDSPYGRITNREAVERIINYIRTDVRCRTWTPEFSTPEFRVVLHKYPEMIPEYNDALAYRGCMRKIEEKDKQKEKEKEKEKAKEAKKKNKKKNKNKGKEKRRADYSSNSSSSDSDSPSSSSSSDDDTPHHSHCKCCSKKQQIKNDHKHKPYRELPVSYPSSDEGYDNDDDEEIGPPYLKSRFRRPAFSHLPPPPPPVRSRERVRRPSPHPLPPPLTRSRGPVRSIPLHPRRSVDAYFSRYAR